MEARRGYLLYCSCPWNALSFLSCFVADIGCQLKFTVIVVIWPMDMMKCGRCLTLCLSPGAGSLRFDFSKEVIRLAVNSVSGGFVFHRRDEMSAMEMLCISCKPVFLNKCKFSFSHIFKMFLQI